MVFEVLAVTATPAVLLVGWLAGWFLVCLPGAGDFFFPPVRFWFSLCPGLCSGSWPVLRRPLLPPLLYLSPSLLAPIPPGS